MSVPWSSVLPVARIGSFWGKSDRSLLLNRNQWQWRERVSETDAEWEERERVSEWEGELLLPNYSDWAGFALLTNRTRFSNPGSPNLTSKHQGTPDWETGREREREKSPKSNKKNFVSLFLASVHTVAPLPSSLPTTTTTSTTGLSHHLDYIFFFLEKRHSREKRKKLVHHHHRHSCPTHVVVSSSFLSSSCLCTLPRRWSESLGLCCCFVCLSQNLRAHLDALREWGAALQYSIWKLWAARQRQAVARCVQDREPCFSTGSPGITSKGSWRRWREGRKRSRVWRRACSSTGESR